MSPPGENRSPDISGDGRYVAFESDATYDAGDTGLHTDVFVRDNVTRSVVRVSVTSNGVAADGSSFDASITHTGRFVAFASLATNLAPVDTNGATDVFWHDRDTDQDGVYDEPGAIRTVEVSAGAGVTGNGQSSSPSVAEHGGDSVVAFQFARVEPAGVDAGYERGAGRLLRSDRRHDRTTELHVHGQLRPRARRTGERTEPATRPPLQRANPRSCT